MCEAFLAQSKGTVRRDISGAKNRLKGTVLINYITASLNFHFKERPSWGKYKASLSILTSIELNLQVELTNSCKQRSPYFQFSIFCYKLQTTSHELPGSSYKLWTTSYEVWNKKYNTYVHEIVPAPFDNMEQHLYHSMVQTYTVHWYVESSADCQIYAPDNTKVYLLLYV
jgi:hypothetical protein